METTSGVIIGRMIPLFLLLIVSLLLHFASSCRKDGDKIQIHMVPHSHDDVGWLKTVDQYYYGSNRTIQDAAVQYTIDTVVMALNRDPTKTFIYVEMAFFKRWWDDQNIRMRNIVRKLVENKQLEFINGGWSMNDEAATHYNAIIDQMTVGLRFINDTFGEDARPTVAWHIDPFGHSAEQASLFSLMSFDGFFLGRIDYDDKDKRVKEKRMEMVWEGSRNLGTASEIFTGVLYNRYSPPPGFCYDETCSDAPIQDNPRLYDMNVKERVDAFVKVTCEQAQHFRTKNIMVTMGDDFNYQNAHRWYKNMDKLIRYVNQDGRVNAFYSTPSRYLKALHDSKKTFDHKTDDFFPYSHRPHSYWTGYFTSRPALKGYIRESNKLLQACKQMEAFRGEDTTSKPSSDFLRRSMAVNQHHDAVTGTEKQHVANDYAKRLYMGRKDCDGVLKNFLTKKYAKYASQPIILDFNRCDYLNISVCRTTETEHSIVVNIYNPIGRQIKSYVKVPVNSRKLIVRDMNGHPVISQVQPVSKVTSQLRNSHKGLAMYELIFEVSLPTLGYSTYFINRTSHTKQYEYASLSSKKSVLSREDNFIENEFIRLEFSSDSGRLIQMVNKQDSLKLNINQNFLWYEGSKGDYASLQTSGAYIFRPVNKVPYPISDSGKVKVKVLKGELVQEVHQIFNEYISQVIRLYKGQKYAEFEYTIGPIPIKDKIGKEIISRFKTSIKNNGVFYTDANGREMKERKRNFRETWKLNSTDPVSQNYYPINSRIFINDSSRQLTIMTDRSQGGSSIKDGEVEIMIHRRLLRDDFLGVGEALNETGVNGKGLVTRGKHLLFLAKPKESSELHRVQGEMTLLEPIISFSRNPYTLAQWRESGFHPVYSALSKPLPKNVHLLTLETTSGTNQIILRMEHFFEKDEDTILSKPVTVNVNDLFTDFNIMSITELNLSANQFLKDKKMWHWNTVANSAKRARKSESVKSTSDEIHLNPMEIRTFLLHVEY